MKLIYLSLIAVLLSVNSILASDSLHSHNNIFKSSIENEDIYFTAGLGNAIFFKNFTPSKDAWSMDVNLNLSLGKKIFVVLGIELISPYTYASRIETGGYLYLGPSYKLNIFQKNKFNFALKLSAVGIANPVHGGLGLWAGVLFSPVVDYYFNPNFSLDFEIKSEVFGIYILNPLVSISLHL